MAYNWRGAILAPDATIKDAINVLNNEALRIVLICQNSKLLGVVSDGDIRRSLLKNSDLNISVSTVMNTNPTIADVSCTRTELLSIMEAKGLLQVPLVKNGEVVGLETLQHLLKPAKLDNPVFIMAGGFGTRLKPLTDECPKPLLKVGGKPILESIIERFIEFGFHNFYISTHYLPEKIREYFGDGSKWKISITYVHEENPLGTGGALGLLPESIPQLPLVMMNGDVLTKVNFKQLVDFHDSQNPDATVCVSEFEYQIPYGVVESTEHRLERIVEKPIHRVFINAGIYVISNKVIQSVKKNSKMDMPTLLDQIMQNNGFVATFPIHEYWLDIGQKNDFAKAQIDYLNFR